MRSLTRLWVGGLAADRIEREKRSEGVEEDRVRLFSHAVPAAHAVTARNLA